MASAVVHDHDEANETTSLLPTSPHPQQAPGGPSSVPPEDNRTRCSWPWLYVVALMVALAVVSDIGEDLYAAPKVRLFESAVCAEYYVQHDPTLVFSMRDIPEHLCKLDPIQDRLASLLGWQLFFDSIPAILFPIPFGYLADTRGRKWILFFALAGSTLSYLWTLFVVGATCWPAQWVWLSSAFFLIGGGPTVGTTLLTTIVADVVPPESRSMVFFYRFCTDLIADLTIPPLTSFLMSKNIWIPLLGAAFCQASSAAIVLAVPETAPWPVSKEPRDDAESDLSDNAASVTKTSPSLGKRFKEWICQTENSLRFVTHDKAVAALVLTFLISKVGRQSTNVLFQYVSKRYGWTLSQAGLLLSLRAAVNIVLFTVILPALAAYVLRRVGKATVSDLLLARGSIIFLLLGTFTLFLSWTSALMILGVVLFTLGTGLPPTARSLVTSLVESRNTEAVSDIGRLYAIISVMEGIGSLVAALGMSWALRLGFQLGQQWLGLPFAFAAILFALVAIVIFSIKIRSVTHDFTT